MRRLFSSGKQEPTNIPPKAEIEEETNMGKKHKKNDNKGQASTPPLSYAKSASQPVSPPAQAKPETRPAGEMKKAGTDNSSSSEITTTPERKADSKMSDPITPLSAPSVSAFVDNTTDAHLQHPTKKEAEKTDAITSFPTTEVTAFNPEAEEVIPVVVPSANSQTVTIEEQEPASVMGSFGNTSSNQPDATTLQVSDKKAAEDEHPALIPTIEEIDPQRKPRSLSTVDETKEDIMPMKADAKDTDAAMNMSTSNLPPVKMIHPSKTEEITDDFAQTGLNSSDTITELKPDDVAIPSSIVITNTVALQRAKKKADGTESPDLIKFDDVEIAIPPTSSVIPTNMASNAPKPTDEKPAGVPVHVRTTKFSVLNTQTVSNKLKHSDDEEIDAFGEFTGGSLNTVKLDDNSQPKPSVIPTTLLEIEDTKPTNQPSTEDLKDLLQQLENVRQQQLIIQRLSNENDSLKALQTEHLSQVEGYDQSISDLKNEIQMLQAGIEEREQALITLREQLILSEEKIKNLLSETANIVRENEQHDSLALDIEKLQRELNGSQQTIDTLTDALTQKGIDPQALLTTQTALTNALSEIESLKNERDTLLQQNARVTTEIKELSRELGIAQEKYETFVKQSSVEYSKLQSAYKTIEIHLETVRNHFYSETVLKDSAIQKQAAAELSLASAQREVDELNQTIIQLRAQIHPLTPSFMTNAIDRENRAKSAIATLEREIVVNSNSARDNALRAIVQHLNTGVAEADPQTYFEQNKEALRRNLQILNNWKSIANTALNVIITVLAIVSVVGITAAWLTGNLEKNAKNHGSQFAFLMFGDLQKGKRAVHEVSEAMTCRIGG